MAFEFYHLSRVDRREAKEALDLYTSSRVTHIKDGSKEGIRMRKEEVTFSRGLRAKLLKLLGPGFPTYVRAWRVARVLERSS